MSESNKRAQVEIAERLQLAWLRHMEGLFESGDITSTDLATLARLLMQNGWNLDPTAIPKGLRDKITNPVSFDDEDEDNNLLSQIMKATG